MMSTRYSFWLFFAIAISSNAQSAVKQEEPIVIPQSAVKEPPKIPPKWRLEDFPNPDANPEACNRAGSRRLCDPDAILSEQDQAAVATAMDTFSPPAWSCQKEASTQHDDEEEPQLQPDIQIAIVLVQQMDLTLYGEHDDDGPDKAAQSFGRSLHDSWGVGHDVPECGGGTGILLFVSIVDRAMYISRGGALDSVLTDARLDRTLEHLKPHLREQAYRDALLLAMDDLQSHIQAGPPTWQERIADLSEVFFVGAWFALFGGIYWFGQGQQRRAQREYARVASQLNEIDQARAMALQGIYRATSCPICLEDFQAPLQTTTEAADGTSTAEDATTGATTTNFTARPTSLSENETPENQNTPPQNCCTIGSDGLPLKLLRCGHVMDDSCWAQWVSSGQGDVSKCPICQQDIGVDTAANSRQENYTGDLQERRDDNEVALVEEQQRERMLRQYRRERNFRLARLALRYPQYVRPQQIQRWTQPTYDGTLARDPSFVRRDPQHTARAMRSDSGSSSCRGFGGSSGGFGGGSSSGGRSGRW